MRNCCVSWARVWLDCVRVFEPLSDLAQRGRLGAFGLLQALLVGLQMLLEGFNERRYLLFPLRQIPLGGLLERRDRLHNPLDEWRLHLLERLLAQGPKGGPLIRQGLVVGLPRLAQRGLVQPFQVGQQLLGGLRALLRPGLRAERVGHLLAQLAQFRLPLRQVLTQFVGQPLVRNRRAAAPLNEAQQKTECGPNQQANEHVNCSGHGNKGAEAVPGQTKPGGPAVNNARLLRSRPRPLWAGLPPGPSSGRGNPP